VSVKTILFTKGGDVISIEPTATLETAVIKHRIGALLVHGPDRRVEPSSYSALSCAVLRKQKTFAQLSARTRQAKETR
jgi:hypothetical protein